MPRRVVITGMGAVTSLGLGADQLWQAVKNGSSGISSIERVEVSDMSVKVASEIKNFDPCQFIEKKEAKRMDRFAQYAVISSQMAL